MPDGFTVDDSELRQFAADLGEVPAVAGRYIRSAVQFSAHKVDELWTAEANGQLGTRGYPPSITYDIKTFQGFGASVIQAEIGPDKERAQGALGNLIEYGGDTHGGLDSRRGVGEAALERVQNDFEKGLSRALEDAEHAAGVDASTTASAGAVIRGSYR
jgi:hypothetical protein